MSEKKVTKATLQREEAMAKVLDKVVPQMFSGPKILTQNAPDSGDTDVWMMTNMPADVLVPLAGLELIAETDKREHDIGLFVDLILRGLKGVNGFNMKVGETIALGLGGGVGRKVVKKPGLMSRNITNRSWRQKAESEGAEIEE